MEEKRKAAALKYDRGRNRAPVVLAKGEGPIAEKLIEIAKKHKIPIIEDKELAEFLIKLDVGSEIPEELYKAVARILAFVYSTIRREYPSK